jgi:hypothetical protein
MCGNIAWSLGNCLASPETVSERFLILIPLHYRSARITVTVGVSAIYAAKDPVKEIDPISVRMNTFTCLSLRKHFKTYSVSWRRPELPASVPGPGDPTFTSSERKRWFRATAFIN